MHRTANTECLGFMTMIILSYFLSKEEKMTMIIFFLPGKHANVADDK